MTQHYMPVKPRALLMAMARVFTRSWRTVIFSPPYIRHRSLASHSPGKHRVSVHTRRAP